jgi:hypothetical protein
MVILPLKKGAEGQRGKGAKGVKAQSCLAYLLINFYMFYLPLCQFAGMSASFFFAPCPSAPLPLYLSIRDGHFFRIAQISHSVTVSRHYIQCLVEKRRPVFALMLH